jgi:hypothetical protein
LSANGAVYYVNAGHNPVARAVLRVDKGWISAVLVYRKADRRRRIATALYALIEAQLGRPLRPSPVRSGTCFAEMGLQGWMKQNSDTASGCSCIALDGQPTR